MTSTVGVFASASTVLSATRAGREPPRRGRVLRLLAAPTLESAIVEDESHVERLANDDAPVLSGGALEIVDHLGSLHGDVQRDADRKLTRTLWDRPKRRSARPTVPADLAAEEPGDRPGAPRRRTPLDRATQQRRVPGRPPRYPCRNAASPELPAGGEKRPGVRRRTRRAARRTPPDARRGAHPRRGASPGARPPAAPAGRRAQSPLPPAHRPQGVRSPPARPAREYPATAAAREPPAPPEQAGRRVHPHREPSSLLKQATAPTESRRRAPGAAGPARPRPYRQSGPPSRREPTRRRAPPPGAARNPSRREDQPPRATSPCERCRGARAHPRGPSCGRGPSARGRRQRRPRASSSRRRSTKTWISDRSFHARSTSTTFGEPSEKPESARREAVPGMNVIRIRRQGRLRIVAAPGRRRQLLRRHGAPGEIAVDLALLRGRRFNRPTVRYWTTPTTPTPAPSAVDDEPDPRRSLAAREPRGHRDLEAGEPEWRAGADVRPEHPSADGAHVHATPTPPAVHEEHLIESQTGRRNPPRKRRWVRSARRRPVLGPRLRPFRRALVVPGPASDPGTIGRRSMMIPAGGAPAQGLELQPVGFVLTLPVIAITAVAPRSRGDTADDDAADLTKRLLSRLLTSPSS